MPGEYSIHRWSAGPDGDRWTRVSIDTLKADTAARPEPPVSPSLVQEATIRFRFLRNKPQEFVRLVFNWPPVDSYELHVTGSSLQIWHKPSGAEPELCATRKRKVKRNKLHWLIFRIEPDPLMPSHPRAHAWLWSASSGNRKPKKPS